VFILSEVGLPKDYTRPTSSGKQFYRNKFTLTLQLGEQPQVESQAASTVLGKNNNNHSDKTITPNINKIFLINDMFTLLY